MAKLIIGIRYIKEKRNTLIEIQDSPREKSWSEN